MKKVIFLTTVFLLLALPIQAKVLPRFQTTGSGGTAKKAVYSGIYVAPKLRGDRKALIVYFSNLSRANNVSYSLTYQTNDQDQGVGGSIDISAGDAASRELFFGTCSAVCIDHTNITSMRFEVVSELTTGRKTIKRYRIRV